MKTIPPELWCDVFSYTIEMKPLIGGGYDIPLRFILSLSLVCRDFCDFIQSLISSKNFKRIIVSKYIKFYRMVYEITPESLEHSPHKTFQHIFTYRRCTTEYHRFGHGSRLLTFAQLARILGGMYMIPPQHICFKMVRGVFGSVTKKLEKFQYQDSIVKHDPEYICWWWEK